MPSRPVWTLRLPDAIRQLEGLPLEHLTRHDLEKLFGVSKRQAVNLLHRLGAEPLGNALILNRVELLKRLRALAKTRAVKTDLERRDRAVTLIRRARLSTVRVAVNPETLNAGLSGLPEGVLVEPRRIEVRYQSAQEAVARLFSLAKALVNDFESFERLVGHDTH
jgi:hypothetical protein